MFERTIAEKSKLRRGKMLKLKEKKKNTNNKLFKEYFTNCQSTSDMYKNYTRQKEQEMRIEYI